MGKYQNAYFKGLEFKIYEPTKSYSQRRITLEGSLHKYWNGGGHNYNDFGIVQLNEVLRELKELFEIDPANCLLKVLEIGVNIQPPVSTKLILQYCLLHKTKILKSVFTRDEGTYLQGGEIDMRNKRHLLKLYDKRKHYEAKGFVIGRDILRIEKKWRRMWELNQLGIYTLADLLKFGLDSFTPHLLKEWESVLFYDWQTLDGTKYEANYSNPNYWQKLQSENFKYHRRNLNRLIQQNPTNLKNQIAQLITEKAAQLNTNPTQINPLHIPLIRVVSTLENEAKKKGVCTVTGLNIEMQREGSFHLSHTGLKYYWTTDRKVFDEVKRKYLSDKWREADRQTQIKELAHNIRNHHNNKRQREKQIYPAGQVNLLEVWSREGINFTGR